MPRVLCTSRKTLFGCLSFGLPLLGYICFASAYDYWLDSGEFVAVSLGLGIAHPPGHPLAAIINGLLRWLPLGPLQLRVAWVCGMCAAASALALFFTFERLNQWLGLRRETPRLVLAFAASLWCAGSYAWWIQASHPEVYALQAALSCWMLERALVIESCAGRDARPLYQLALLWGLALANHHFLAFLMVPALAPTAWLVCKQHRVRSIAWSFVAVSLGLFTYAYLPLRANADPFLNLGKPNTFSNFIWLISARAFQKNTGSGVPQPFTERFLDVWVQLVMSLHWSVVILAFLGLYTLWRIPITRRLAAVFSIMLIVFVGARAWLGFVRSNPDALGYLMMAHVALVAGALSFIATLLRLAEDYGLNRIQRYTTLCVVVLLLASGFHAFHTLSVSSLRSSFNATDVFADPRRRDLPPKSIVLVHTPATLFQYWSGEATEQLRPDIEIVPVPLLSYPGMQSQLTKRTPALHDLLMAYQQSGKFQVSELESLAAIRPLFVEMDTRILTDLTRSLAPWGLLYQVLPGGATTTDVHIAHRAQEALYDRMYRSLGSSQLAYHETAQQLLWLHYMDALYYASFGMFDASLIAIEHGLHLQPLAHELRQLKAYLLHQPTDKPVDVTPFVPQ